MKQPIRILDSGLRPARWNIAMTAALAELHARGEVGDTVRFHRYPACVLLGRSQDAERVADLAYCRGAGIGIARRITGGGAVFMSPRMLAWDVVVDRCAWGSKLEAVTSNVCTGIASGLARLGVAASFCAPNAIMIGGRKLSGSSGYAVGGSAILQGTVLLEDETHIMARALRLAESAVRETMICLDNAIGAPSLDVVTSAIAPGLAEASSRELAPEEASSVEIAMCERLLCEEIGPEEFVVIQDAALNGSAAA